MKYRAIFFMSSLFLFYLISPKKDKKKKGAAHFSGKRPSTQQILSLSELHPTILRGFRSCKLHLLLFRQRHPLVQIRNAGLDLFRRGLQELSPIICDEMYCVKGGFTRPLHYVDWRLICGRMTQA